MMAGMLAEAKVPLEAPALVHALATHADPLIRGLAADALGLQGEQSAEAPLLRALQDDPERSVREAAALALARLGNGTGLAALKEFMSSSNSPVRQLTMAAQLAELGEPAGFPLIAEAAGARQDSMRSLAAQFLPAFVALEGLVDDQGRPPTDIFLSLAKDESSGIRLAVVRALPAAVSKGLDLGAARAVARQLAERDSDLAVRDSAKMLLDAWHFDDEEKVRRERGAM